VLIGAPAMSDFTKYELEYLYNFVYRGAASIRVDKHDELRVKLKSMIDSSVADRSLISDKLKTVLLDKNSTLELYEKQVKDKCSTKTRIEKIHFYYGLRLSGPILLRDVEFTLVGLDWVPNIDVTTVAEQQYETLIKRRDEITKDIKKLEAFLLSEGK
jgi:hypothetical protein